MEKDHILFGIHIGEHGFNADTVIDEINERCIEPGLIMSASVPEGRCLTSPISSNGQNI